MPPLQRCCNKLDNSGRVRSGKALPEVEGGEEVEILLADLAEVGGERMSPHQLSSPKAISAIAADSKVITSQTVPPMRTQISSEYGQQSESLQSCLSRKKAEACYSLTVHWAA